jgi:YD repeat-containing protein
LNGDGLQDLLLLDGDPSSTNDCDGTKRHATAPIVLYSDGKNYHPVTLPKQSPRLRHDNWANGNQLSGFGWAATAVGDVDGDAQPDIVQLVENKSVTPPFKEFEVIKRTEALSDVIIAVRDGLKSGSDGFAYQDMVSYADIGSSDTLSAGMYTKTADCLRTKSRCLTKGIRVVRDFSSNRPVAAGFAYAQRYSYTNARADLGGRGFLGFEKVVVKDPLAGTEVTRTYDLTSVAFGSGRIYPYVGIARDTWQRSSATYRSPTAPAGWSTAGEAAQHTVSTLELRYPTFGGYYVREKSSVAEVFDSIAGNAAVRIKKTSDYTYDSYGNTRVATTTTDQGTKETVDTAYVNDVDAWQIGLPRYVTQTRIKGTSTIARRWEFAYFADGKLSFRIREPDGTPEDEQITSFKYNSNGTVSDITVTARDLVAVPAAAFAQRSTHIDYDSEGIFPKGVTNPLGHVTWMDFDPALGVPLVSADANSVVTRFKYDGFARLREVLPTGAAASTFSFGASSLSGGVYSVTANQGSGEVSVTDFDLLNRAVRHSSLGFDGSSIDTRRTFDELGRVSTESLPFVRGGTPSYEQYKYDALGRPIEVKHPNGDTLKTTYPTFFEQRYFDEASNESYSISDSDGLVTTAGERVVSALAGVAHWVTTATAYDAFGNPTSSTRSGTGATSVSSTEYDVLGRPKKQVDPTTGTTKPYFSAFDELTSFEDAAAEKTRYKRDALGRPIEITSPTGTETFQWDTGLNGKGKLYWSTSSSGVSKTYKYNSNGQLVTVETRPPQALFTTSIQYDAAGRPDVLTLPGWPGNWVGVRYRYQNGYVKSVEDAATAAVSAPAA